MLGWICLVIKVSVLLPVYGKDSPVYLKKAIESLLLSNNYIDEVIIVEDGPVPDTLSIVYSNLNFNIISLKNNRGLAYALNIGLREARNLYVARMDSDDICSPERFKLQLDYITNNPEVDILGTAVSVIDKNDKFISSRSYPITDSDIKRNIWKCPIAHPSVVYKKNKILSVGGYNHKLKRRQDYELWFRCVQRGFVFANLAEELLYYRQTDSAYKKDSFRLSLKQSLIALKWLPKVKSPLYTYFIVLYPVFKSLLPDVLKLKFDKFKNKFFSKF